MSDASKALAQRLRGDVAPADAVPAANSIAVGAAIAAEIFHINQPEPYRVLSLDDARLALQRPNPPMLIGCVEIDRAYENRGTVIMGMPGSGKTQTIKQIGVVKRSRGSPAVFLDVGGEYTQFFYDPETDYIQNSFDARGVGWSPFNEIEEDSDFDEIAALLIRDQKNNQDWVEQQRVLVADTMRALYKLGDTYCTTEWLLYFLLKAPLRSSIDVVTEKSKGNSLQDLLADEPAARNFEPGNDRSLGTLMGMLTKALAPLKYLKPGTFSVRKFVRSFETPGEQRGWLFLTVIEKNKRAVGPLLSLWTEIAIKESLSLSENSQRDFTFVLDEFGQLPRIDLILDFVTQGRKFGGSAVAGFQSYSMMVSRYGKEDAVTLIAAFGSCLMLRTGEPEAAKFMSEMVGDTLREETSTSNTVTRGQNGAETHTEATSVSLQQRAVVLPSDFMLMPYMTGYLRVANASKIISIGDKPNRPPRPNERNAPALTATAMPIVTEKQISREDASLAWLRRNDPAWRPLDGTPVDVEYTDVVEETAQLEASDADL